MINWRRILVTGMVAGMIAVTGCSSNLPETNQGNRNGQRVVDAVNHRTDTYNTTTRSSAARRAERPTRNARNYSRGLRTRNTTTTRHGTTTRHNTPARYYANRNVVDGVTRNLPNRNVNNHNRGRVGHTFGYTPMSAAHSPEEYGSHAYDYGMYAGYQAANNPAINNNRAVRTAPVHRSARANRSAATVAPKAAATTRNASTRKTSTATTPVATASRVAVTTPKATPKPAISRNTTPVRAYRTNQPTRSTNPTQTRANTTRGAVRRNDAIGFSGIENHTIEVINHNQYNTTANNHKPNNAVRPNKVANVNASHDSVYRNTNNGRTFTHNERSTDIINPAIYASTSEDGDYAFFKRNKTDLIETPAPPPAPTNVPNRNSRITPNVQPETTATPVPTVPSSLSEFIFDDNDDNGDNDNIHDIYDNADDIHDNIFDTNDNNGNQLKPLPKTNPAKSTPVRRAGQRVMK